MSQVKRAAHLQLIGLILTILCGAVALRTLPIPAYIASAQHAIGSMETWGLVLYPALYATCNLLLLPGGIIAIGSGLFFGLWAGFLVNLTGNVAAAAIAFTLSRKLGRRRIEHRIFRHEKWASLDSLIARDGWKIIFLSQLHPLFPTSLLNYLYGITRIPFRTCILWIALGQAPGLFLYAYLGTLAQFGLRIWRGESHPHGYEYAVWVGGLVVTVAITVGLGRIALRILGEAELAAQNAPVESAVQTDIVANVHLTE